MLCNKCHRNSAVFHSKTIINGSVSEEHLCSECVDDCKLNSFHNFIEDLFVSPFELISPSLFGIDMNSYESNYLMEDRNNNKYHNYKSILDKAVQSIRIGADSTTTLTPTEVELRAQLATAVENEEYEKASEIKKELDKIKQDKGDANV